MNSQWRRATSRSTSRHAPLSNYSFATCHLIATIWSRQAWSKRLIFWEVFISHLKIFPIFARFRCLGMLTAAFLNFLLDSVLPATSVHCLRVQSSYLANLDCA